MINLATEETIHKAKKYNSNFFEDIQISTTSEWKFKSIESIAA
jgi:hypothetical protein